MYEFKVIKIIWRRSSRSSRLSNACSTPSDSYSISQPAIIFIDTALIGPCISKRTCCTRRKKPHSMICSRISGIFPVSLWCAWSWIMARVIFYRSCCSKYRCCCSASPEDSPFPSYWQFLSSNSNVLWQFISVMLNLFLVRALIRASLEFKIVKRLYSLSPRPSGGNLMSWDDGDNYRIIWNYCCLRSWYGRKREFWLRRRVDISWRIQRTVCPFLIMVNLCCVFCIFCSWGA